MARFEESPDLFGLGVGCGTYGNIDCDWCGERYRGRERRNKERTPISNEAIRHTRFGRKEICECCFEEIESAVLARMDDIIPWYIRILRARRLTLEERERMIDALRKALEG